MKRSKLYSILMSVLVAFGLWLYVFTNVSDEDEITFHNISVVIDGEAMLDDRNLMVTGISTQTVSLRLSGTRSDLNKVSSENLTAKVNLSNISEPGEKIPVSYTFVYPTGVSDNDFVEEAKSPGYIYVDVDTRRTKEIPVLIQWTGSRSEDYIYDTENAVLDYPTITVSGPATVADLIDHAYVEVDLTEQLESLSETYRYTLCDANGEPVDAQQITTNVEEVRLELKVQRIKEVQLVAEVIYGGGATELNTIVEVTPKVIRLSGSEAILAELGDTLTVGTINLAEIERSQELKFAINIPEGVTNRSGVTEAVANVRFSGLSIREFVVEDIQVINVPEGLEAEIINNSLTVKVRGVASEISLLTDEDISAVVDLSAAEVGNATYKATLVFTEEFPNVGALKTYSVPAAVREAEE